MPRAKEGNFVGTVESAGAPAWLEELTRERTFITNDVLESLASPVLPLIST